MGRIPNMGTKTFGGVREEVMEKKLIKETKNLSNVYSPEITKLMGNRFVRAWKVLVGKL